jgi:hypothetical protein
MIQWHSKAHVPAPLLIAFLFFGWTLGFECDSQGRYKNLGFLMTVTNDDMIATRIGYDE